MKKRYQAKRFYSSPQMWPTEVAFEVAFLQGSGRFLIEADELEHRYSIFGEDGNPSAEGEPLYIEF